MSNFNYKARRVQKPSLNIASKSDTSFGPSLSALNDAWSSIAATKKEINQVNHRIRQVSSPIGFYHDDEADERLPPPPPKNKNNPNIERRTIYQMLEQTKTRKENIPPPSYPQPNLHRIPPSVDEINTYNIHDEHPQRNTSLRSLSKRERKSEALKRLKEKIQQQKINSSTSTVEEAFPYKTHHNENDIVQHEDERIPQQAAMTRKVAHAPTAPTYTGFNLQPDATFVKSTVKVSPQMKRKSKAKKASLDQAKTNKRIAHDRKKAKVSKNQRVVATKKSTTNNIITTSSWRVGQQIQRKYKKEMTMHKEEKSEYKSDLATTTKTNQTSDLKSDKENNNSTDSHSKKTSSNLHSELDKDLISEKADEKIFPDHSKSPVSEEQKSDTDSLRGLEQLQDDVLTKTAKDVMAELQHKDETSPVSKRKKLAKAVVDTGQKSQATKKSPSVKRKLDEVLYPTKKERHYDPSEVKKYMIKQQAERKRRRIEEQAKQRKQKEEQELKLQELYKKQKAAVKGSNAPAKRSNVGYSTFIKDDFAKKLSAKTKFNEMMKGFDYPGEAEMDHIPEKDMNDIFSTTINGTTSSRTLADTETEFDDIATYNDHENDVHFSIEQANNDRLLSPPAKDKKTTMSPSKADRIAAIRQTATALRERLMEESKRLTGLVQNKQSTTSMGATREKIKSPGPSASTLQRVAISRNEEMTYVSHFPGVENLDSQAKLNNKIDEMETAARKIQAAYRGFNVRQGLHSWELPSGRTLHQTMEEARRRAFIRDLKMEPQVQLASALYEKVGIPSKIPERRSKSPDSKSAFSSHRSRSKSPDSKVTDRSAYTSSFQPSFPPRSPDSKPSDRSLRQTSTNRSRGVKSPHKDEQSLQSLISEALESSKVSLDDAENTLSSISKKTHSRPVPSQKSSPTYKEDSEQDQSPKEEDDHRERLRKIMEKYKDVPEDRYSVINIFARNYPGLRQQQLSEERHSTLPPSDLTPNSTETEELIADAKKHEDKTHQEDDEVTRVDGEDSLHALSEQTLTGSNFSDGDNSLEGATLTTSHNKPTSLNVVDKTDTPSLKHQSQSKTPSYRSLMSPKTNSDSENSEILFSPRTVSPGKVPSSQVQPSGKHQTLDLSYTTEETVSPRRSPTLFSDRDGENPLDPVLTSTRRSPRHEPVKNFAPEDTPVTHNVNTRRGDDRMSPNALERRLRAELNLFDTVGDSLQQVTEMDRVRDIVQAQQETVSLAQVLKNRQVLHQKELDRMSIEAREKAAQSARDIEIARRNALEAETKAQKVIAEVKSQAAENVAVSTQAFSKQQNEATALSLDAIKESEKVRRDAFEEYKKSVDDRLANIGGIMNSAVSAASTAAVEVALRQHREKLESLRKESLHKVSKTFTSFSEESSTVSDRSTTSPTKTSYQTGSSVSTAKDLSIEQQKDKSEISEEIRDETPSRRNISSAKSPSYTEPVSESYVSASKLKSSPEISERLPTSNRTSPASKSDISEQLPTTKRTSSVISEKLPSSAGDNTDVTEDVPTEVDEDKELTEALFSTGKKSVSRNETIQSNYSDEKFQSSFTEDDLKHDFRQVLPSENHRRKSLDVHRDFIVSGNDETSSDEMLPAQKVAEKVSKKRTRSPFVAEDTFTRFTSDMVRQYIQEEEVRAKHQASLLALREKAIIDKTKAEIAFLETQKKSLMKKKGARADDKMPPINKKQRALMKRLESEQAEIRRIKQAHKAASEERKFMLQQQQDIQRIQQSTKKIWNRIGHYDDVTSQTSDKLWNQIGKYTETSEKSSDSSSTIKEEVKSSSATSSIITTAASDGSDSRKTTPRSIPQSPKSTQPTPSISEEVLSKPSPTSQGSGSISEHVPSKQNSRTQSSKSISEAFSKEKSTTKSISEATSLSKHDSIASIASKKTSSTPNTVTPPDEATMSAADEVFDVSQGSSLSKDLKQLKYVAGKKYLTEREMKLQAKKQQFSEIMNRKTKLKTWRQKIIEEEMRLKADIRKVLNQGIMKMDETSGRDSGEDSVTNDSPTKPTTARSSSTATTSTRSSKRHQTPLSSTIKPRDGGEGEHSFVDPPTSVSSIAEEDLDVEENDDTGDRTITEAINGTGSTTKATTPRESESAKVPSSGGSYSYSNDFEEPSPSSVSRSRPPKDLKKSEEDSWTEGTSDASDAEQRLKLLENQLRRKRSELQKLRKQKEKEKLRQKEQELRRELQVVEQQINKENIPAEVNLPKVTPRVLSPRSSLDTVILPEKIKIPSDKESRRSLDFSDRESESDRSLSSNKSSKGDASSSRHSTIIATATNTTRKSPDRESIKDESSKSTSKTLTKSDKSSLKSDKSVSRILTDTTNKKAISERQDSIDDISDISAGKDRSSVSGESKESSIAEEIISTQTPKTSVKGLDAIYDDDLFESELSLSSSTSTSISQEKTSSKISLSSKETSRSNASTARSTSRESTLEEKSVSPNATLDEKTPSVRESLPPEVDKSITKFSVSEEVPVDPISQKEETLKESKIEIVEYSSKFESGESTVRSERSEKDIKVNKSEPISKDATEVDTNRSISEKLHSNHSTSRSITSSLSKTSSTTSRSSLPAQDEFSKSNVSNAYGFRVNERVKVEGSLMGTIRYLGKTSFSPVLVAGIELDEPLGTNDGTFHDKQYFKCAQDHGFFTTIERLQHFNSEVDKVDKQEKDTEKSLSSTTLEEIDESLDQASVKEDSPKSTSLKESSLKSTSVRENSVKATLVKASVKESIENDEQSSVKSYSEHFEPVSGATPTTQKTTTHIDPLTTSKKTDSLYKQHYTTDDHSSSSTTIGETTKSIEIELDEIAAKTDDTASTISVEIPSPKKLDTHTLADNITDSLLKSIILDSVQAMSPRLDSIESPQKSASSEEEPPSSKTSSKDTETPVHSTSKPKPHLQIDNHAENVCKSLLNDAVSVMLEVGRKKDEKLTSDKENEVESQRNKDDFLSLIIPGVNDMDEDLDSDSDKENNVLSQKRDQLKNLHDEMDKLFEREPEDDQDLELIESVGKETMKETPKKELPLRIPLNEKDTREIVNLALQEIQRQNFSMSELERLIVPDSILALETYGEIDVPSTMLYKTLIFDLTLQLYCELKEFRDIQAKPRPIWLKRPRKTFSKFTRQVHLDESNSFPDLVKDHVCGCIGLQSGRPSLMKLKRKLPLNLEKKDYVDAVLVDELRQEEGQWVNYDEDELRVKFQLADNILESLLEETVDIINQALS